MKKLLCFALTLAMLLTLVPLTVFATTTPQGNPGSTATTLTDLDREKLADTSATYVCRVGDGTDASTTTYYTSFGAAIGYMGSTYGNNVTSINMTVTLIRDITTTDQWMTATSTRNQIKAGSATAGTQLIIEGNGCTIAPVGNTTSSNKNLAKLFEWVGGYLAFRNATITVPQILSSWPAPNSTQQYEFTNCTVTTTGVAVYIPVGTNDAAGDFTVDIDITNSVINSSNSVIDVRHSRVDTIANNAHEIDIVNSTLTANNAGLEVPVINLRDDDPWTITVDASTLKSEGAKAGNAGKYEGVIHAKTHMTVNVKNGSVLENASTNAWISVFALLNTAGEKETAVPATVALTIDATSKLALTGSNLLKTADFFALLNGASHLTLNDAGATYAVSKAVAAYGVNLPAATPTVAVGSTFLGWAGAGTVAAAGEKYTNANAPEAGVELKPFTVAADDFVMKDGAGIRTAEPIGIRFTVKVSDDLLAMIADSGLTATYSTVIAPNKYVLEAGEFDMSKMLNGDYLIATQTAAPNAADADSDGYVSYYAALVDLPANKTAVTMEFAAMGMLTLSDGTNEIVLYTVFDAEKNVNSMLDVAQRAYAGGVTDNALVNRIIELGTAQ